MNRGQQLQLHGDALPRIFDFFEKTSMLKTDLEIRSITFRFSVLIYAHHIRVLFKPFLWYAKGAETNTAHHFEDIMHSSRLTLKISYIQSHLIKTCMTG